MIDTAFAKQKRDEAAAQLTNSLGPYVTGMKEAVDHCQKRDIEYLAFVKGAMENFRLAILDASDEAERMRLAETHTAIASAISHFTTNDSESQARWRGIRSPLMVPELEGLSFGIVAGLPVKVLTRTPDAPDVHSMSDDVGTTASEPAPEPAPPVSLPKAEFTSAPTALVEPVMLQTTAAAALEFLKATIERLCSDYDRLTEQMKTQRWTKEYAAICSVGLEQPFMCSRSPQNVAKNRYNNIMAYDHSRVVLPSLSLTEQLHQGGIKDPDPTYINGNWISGFHGPREYIATQGPVPASIGSFWRMVVSEKVEVIVMVTRTIESGRMKCHRYWPDPTEGGSSVLKVGGITVTYLGQDNQVPTYTIRCFLIQEEGVSWQLRQYAYNAWPDHGIPDSTAEILGFRMAIRSSVRKEGIGAPPIVVHCSAGVGRTGTFIGIDTALNAIAAQRGEVDIEASVRAMRVARNLMVQTEAQFLWIYTAVIDGLFQIIDSGYNGLADGTEEDVEAVARTWAPLVAMAREYQRGKVEGGNKEKDRPIQAAESPVIPESFDEKNDRSAVPLSDHGSVEKKSNSSDENDTSAPHGVKEEIEEVVLSSIAAATQENSLDADVDVKSGDNSGVSVDDPDEDYESNCDDARCNEEVFESGSAQAPDVKCPSSFSHLLYYIKPLFFIQVF